MNNSSDISTKHLQKSNRLAIDAEYELFEASYEHNKALMDEIFSNLQRIKRIQETIHA